MKSLFDFSALYHISCIVSSCFALCCVANRVETMHDLLSCSGWLGMASLDQQIEIIDRRRPDEPERRWTVSRLLATPVTEGNVTGKIQLAHQFLSCSYARVLVDLCDYEQGVGPQCRKKDTPSKSFDCLEDYLQVARYKCPVVSRMTGALSSLQGLAPSRTHFENAVFTMLADLETRCKRNDASARRPPDDDSETTRRTADAESKAVEEHARHVLHRLLAFYNRYCWPVSYWIRSSGLSKPAEDIKGWDTPPYPNNSGYVIHKIKEALNEIVKRFMESHEATSGFEYDPESNATRIMTYGGPDVAERVEKLNRLLGNYDFWFPMRQLEIKVPGNPYRTTLDDLRKPVGRVGRNIVVVNRENLPAKIKQAHQFMSCQHAAILLECFHYVTDMWSNCKESENGSAVCLDKFLRILNEVDASVLRTIDALEYFYKLSPDTVYDKCVFDLLKRYKNFYDDITARADRDAMSLSAEIERDLLEIAQNSTGFFQQFCDHNSNINFFYFPAVDTRPIDVKGEHFKRRMLQLTYFYDVFDL